MAQIEGSRQQSNKGIIGIFVGFWFTLLLFFKTLLLPFNKGKQNSNNERRSGAVGSVGRVLGNGAGVGSGGRGDNVGANAAAAANQAENAARQKMKLKNRLGGSHTARL